MGFRLHRCEVDASTRDVRYIRNCGVRSGNIYAVRRQIIDISGKYNHVDHQYQVQSAFHALRPEDLPRALRFFSACGVQTNKKTFSVRKLFSSWRAKLHAAQA